MKEYTAYVVGRPFSTARTVWEERSDFAVRKGLHMFVQTAKNLKPADIEGFQGKVHLGLLPCGPVFFFVFKIEGFCTWSDISYWQGFIPQDERALPNESGGDMAVINMILVNADTGIVEALRSLTVSPRFTSKLHSLIAGQLATLHTTTPEAVNHAIQEAYRKYPNSDKMARACVITERAGMPRS